MCFMILDLCVLAAFGHWLRFNGYIEAELVSCLNSVKTCLSIDYFPSAEEV